MWHWPDVDQLTYIVWGCLGVHVPSKCLYRCPVEDICWLWVTLKDVFITCDTLNQSQLKIARYQSELKINQSYPFLITYELKQDAV